MKAVILSLNSQYIHASLAPFCLLAGVKEYGEKDIVACVTEGTVNEPVALVADRVEKEKPEVIGFCCYIWNINRVYELIALLKSRFSFTAVLGGPEVSYNAAEVLSDHPEVDYILSGEGEQPFAMLLNAIKNGNGFEKVGGFCHRTGGIISVCPPYNHKGAVPSPYTDEYMVAVKGRIAYMETSRGCPYRCAFCLSGKCAPLCYFDLEKVKKTMLRLACTGCKVVKLVDRTFNADRHRAAELFRFICEHYGKEIPSGVCFHFEIAGDILDRCEIELLRNAPRGSIQLEIGMQSFNEKTLSAVNRTTDTQKLICNIRQLTEKKNIHIHLDLIAGLPYEDLTSFAHSFAIGFSLHADMLQLGFLKLLHGAPMREEPEHYPCVYHDTPPYEVIETPWLNTAEIRELKYCETALDRLCNSGRFPRTVHLLFEEKELDPFTSLIAFGRFTGVKSRPLYEYVNCVYEFFASLCDRRRLRDCLICDSLSAAALEQIPAVLRRDDPRLRTFRNYLSANHGFDKAKGLRRRCFLLETEQVGAYIDYTDNNKEGNGYRIEKVPFSEFLA